MVTELKEALEHIQLAIDRQNGIIATGMMPKLIHDECVIMVKHLNFIVNYIKDNETIKEITEKHINPGT